MLSQRLKTILAMVPDDIETVWDLCCDHGHLGNHLAQRQKVRRVNLVDCVPSIIQRLELANEKCHKFAIRAQEVQIEWKNSECVILAGVGAHLVIDILNNILRTFLYTSSFFVFCPHQNIEKLRKFLIQQKFQLRQEKLIHDAGKFYQVFSGTFSQQKSNLSELGASGLWQQGEISKLYWQKQWNHFTRQQNQPMLESLKAIKENYGPY